ncbi:hypothetical protein [Sphingorhabdus sp. Alg239-R122]|uniref:hypothetical protein n=1 Tax=Sphingorhabdus sp. Alg239-R122 TaxID=2305989 RepID=UPI0013DC3344|nr:hypothetical protein [Sphingorhabdus sp. Alg239-R122]
MSFFRTISPRAAWADLVEIWQGEQRYKIHFMGAALFASLLIFTAFFFESGFEVEPKPNKIIYVENWNEGRSDEEILAARKALMEEIAERKALREAREKEIRESYRRLGKRFGMDMEDTRYERAKGDTDAAGPSASEPTGQPAAK